MTAHIHISSDLNFLALSKREPNPRMRIRLLALHNIKSGASVSSVARTFEISRSTIYEWIHRVNEGGVEALIEKPGRGRKTKLNREEIATVIDFVSEKAKNFTGGRLFIKDVQRYVLDTFNVEYATSSLYQLLARNNIVWITSRSVSPHSCEKSKNTFKKNFSTC